MDYMELINIYNPGNLEKFYKDQLPNANMGGTVMNVAIAAIIVFLVSLIVSLFGTAIQGMLGASTYGGMGSAVASGTTSILMNVVWAIVNVVMFFVGAFLLHILATVFGGKGTSEQLLYLMSLATLGLAPVWAIITLLMAIPCVGCLFLLVALIVVIYNLFLSYKAVEMTHGLESGKAIMAVVAFAIIMLAVYVVLYLLILFLGMASLLGMGAMTGGFY